MIENYQDKPIPPKGVSVVYFVQIGKLIKIGFSTNLPGRLHSFLTTTIGVTFIASVPGDRALEKELHGLLSEARAARELFHRDARIDHFINYYEHYGLEKALEYLRESTPARRAAKKAVDRQARVKAARLTREQENAYYRSCVDQRKRELGW